MRSVETEIPYMPKKIGRKRNCKYGNNNCEKPE